MRASVGREHAAGMTDLDRRGRGLKVAGLVIVALGALSFLALGVGEMVGGEPSGFQHLPEAALLGALGYLGWRHPHAVGIVLVLISLGSRPSTPSSARRPSCCGSRGHYRSPCRHWWRELS